MINDKADKIVEIPFESLLNRYQIGLEKSMAGSDFIFDCVHLFYRKCHKINFKWAGPYINSPNWIKDKKVTINLINRKDNTRIQYAITVTLDNEEIGKHPERRTKI